MALSKRIVETIGKCAGDDRQLNDDLIKILSQIEEEKQPKRVIDPVLERVKKESEMYKK